ncbi:MAG TPA: glutathione peroxidase [Janthinobacterium sp.]|nr:glutathione peroxidase [Janthinobacterium sp.]
MLPSAASLELKPVPQVTFKTRTPDQWQDVSSDALFKNKTVVVFSLPGAYTPTCSSTHLPRYNELAATFKANGVDDIVCISVNDAFVMNEWKAGQDAANVTVIPDGNGDFTSGMGLLVDKRNLGFGMRSWRYSMLVKNGIIEKMFIEPEKEGDPFEVSDADTMLNYINPAAKAPPSALIFAKPGCPHCARAKAALQAHGLDYTEITMSQKINSKALRAVAGATTWPQVFIGGALIGDADALDAYFASGALARGRPAGDTAS